MLIPEGIGFWVGVGDAEAVVAVPVAVGIPEVAVGVDDGLRVGVAD